MISLCGSREQERERDDARKLQRTACTARLSKCDSNVTMSIGMLKRIPAGRAMTLGAAGAVGGPVNRTRLQRICPFDVVLPAGAITDRAHRNVPTAFGQLAEEVLSSLLGTPRLDQDVKHMSALIDGAPEVVACPVDRHTHLVDVIVTTHNTLALVFPTQVYKLKRDMSKKNCPASAASCAFMQNEVMEVHSGTSGGLRCK